MQEKLLKSNFIKERIIYFVENQRIKKVDFFSKIGATSANFRGDQLKSSLSSSTIERIITNYPQINLRWLITGVGQMLEPVVTEEKIVAFTEPEASYTNSENGFWKEIADERKYTIDLQRQQISDLENRLGKINGTKDKAL